MSQPPLRLTKRGENVIAFILLLITGLVFFTGLRVGLDRWEKQPVDQPVTFVVPESMPTPRWTPARSSRSRPQAVHKHVHTFPAIMLRIRKCESHDNYRAQNPTNSASGAWQIIDGTWNNFHGYRRAIHAPRHVQDLKALALYKDRGTQPWNASKGCWS